MSTTPTTQPSFQADEPGKITYTRPQQAKIDAVQEQYDAAQASYAKAIETHNETDPAHPEISTALASMQTLRRQLLELKATNGLKQVFTPSTQPRGGVVMASTQPAEEDQK